MSASRSDLASQYIDQLPYPPYPVQEEALLAWFTADQGRDGGAPPPAPGRHSSRTRHCLKRFIPTPSRITPPPLIALTEQKFTEMQAAAIRWGFKAEDVGLVTGNRRVNPNARVLIVVAEILLNRLLNQDGFDFSQVSAVVMDEFHSFADPERGIVWGIVAQHAAEAHPLAAAVRDRGQRGGIHELARPPARAANRTRRRTRAKDSPYLPLGARSVSQRTARGHGEGRRRHPQKPPRWCSPSTAMSVGALASS